MRQRSSEVRFTVSNKAVRDVVDAQHLLEVRLLHVRVDGPGYNLHAPLSPKLNVIPAGTDSASMRRGIFIPDWFATLTLVLS